MPTKDQIRKATQRHSEPKEERLERQEPERDLDSPDEQERILHPIPGEVTFEDGYTIKLHEPSLKDRRPIFGFATNVLLDCVKYGDRGALLQVRIVAMLNSRPDVAAELFFWAGKLFGKAGSISDDQAKEIAAEIDGHTNPKKDMLGLFEAVATIAGADFRKN